MRDAFGKDETSDPSCPIYNKETKLCTSYDYRPMSCRTYPLEFDGAHFAVVDDECEGLDNGEMSADDRKNMKDLATRMNVQLTQMRIMMPVIAQSHARIHYPRNDCTTTGCYGKNVSRSAEKIR